jgi:hypothetical protein
VHRPDKRSRAFHGIDARFFGRLQFTFEISIVRRVGGGIQSLCAAESFEFVAAIAGPLTPTEPATPAPDRMDLASVGRTGLTWFVAQPAIPAANSCIR